MLLFSAALSFAVAAFVSNPAKASASAAPLPGLYNAPMSDKEINATGAILPKAAVWYHGVRVGEYESDSASVSDVLDHFNITLLENDRLNFSFEDGIFWGMNICIDEVIYEEIAITEDVPFETVEIPCLTIPKGERQVKTEGVNGVSGSIIYTKKVNGEVVQTDTKETTVFKAPVTKEVLVGTGGVYTAPDGTEYNYSYYIDVVATAYTHTGDPTYCGTVAEVGVIAVDPRYIPLRSNVYVIGNYGDYGVCRAEDIGGGIKRARIDVFLDSEAECVQFGRRNMRCYVLE